MRLKILKDLKDQMQEYYIKEKIHKRSQAEKMKLRTRRILSVLSAIVILIGGFLFIIFTNIYEDEVQDKIEQMPFLAKFSNFIPEAALSFANIIVPMCLGALVEFEKWDSPSSTLMQEIWRDYAS